MTGLQIDLRTSSTDLHSGMYGATVPNALQALAKLAYSFHDADGRVAIEGFYDDVVELSPEERAELAAHPQSEAELLEEAGVSAAWGEPGYSAKERQGARPTIDFNGIWGGFQGEGTKTVTPAEAHLKVTSRLVPNQDPAKISELIKKHALTHAPEGATVTFSNVRARRTGLHRPARQPAPGNGRASPDRAIRKQAGHRAIRWVGPDHGDLQGGARSGHGHNRLRTARQQRPRAERVVPRRGSRSCPDGLRRLPERVLMGSWQQHLDSSCAEGLDELFDILRIPSVSTEPAYAGDVRRCAEWVADRLTRAGVPEVEILETALHPVVFGRWHAAPGKPTLLIYGHYDVQPVDPIDLWTTDPFEPTVRDGKIYARGVSDMKANLVTVVQAVEAARPDKRRASGQPDLLLRRRGRDRQPARSRCPEPAQGSVCGRPGALMRWRSGRS